MNLLSLYYIIVILLVTGYSCTSHKSLIGKDQSPFGKVRFYSMAKGADTSSAFMYADVDSSDTKVFYSFYPNDILKTKEDDKVVKYSLYYGKHPQAGNPNIFQRFSSLDWIVFKKGDSIVRAKGWKAIDFSGCEGFEVTIYQMHGWPKGKEFKPL